jgi:hypothetical protein
VHDNEEVVEEEEGGEGEGAEQAGGGGALGPSQLAQPMGFERDVSGFYLSQVRVYFKFRIHPSQVFYRGLS